MKNGTLIDAGWANKIPAKTGANAAPVVLDMPAMPAAADRSCGGTTAIVYDCRVGTSIWLILNRRSRTAIASETVGIRGIRIRRILEGRCVKTMVFTRPKRDARRDARSAETPEIKFATKKISPRLSGVKPKRR